MKKEIIVIRFLKVNKYDFVAEHSTIINKEKTVWMLKTGKYIPAIVLDEVLRNGGKVILKAPKAIGGKYYLTHFHEYKHGMPEKGMNYPKYYNCLPKDYEKPVLDGTWLRIDQIYELKDEEVHKLRLCSSSKRLEDVVSQTRTTVMYVYVDLS